MYYETRITKREQQIGQGLSVLWGIGLLCGAGYAFRYSADWFPMLEEAAGCSVRWTGALCVTLFPMLISLAVVGLLGRRFIWVLCPVRAFLVGIIAGAVGLCWGRQAPVIAGLFLFSGLLSSSVLLTLWNRVLCADLQELKMDAAVLTGIQLLIAAADIWIVSPFLVEVINY